MDIQTAAFALIILLLLVTVFLAIKLAGSGGNSKFLLMQQQLDALKGQLSEGFMAHGTSVNNQITQSMNHLNQQLTTFNQQFQNTTGQIGNRLDSAGKAVGEVRQTLGELGKSAEKIFEVGKDISSLKEILQAPKLRGGLGELLLADLLAQILPSQHFSIQHTFKSGEIVDAVISLESGFVPVDSKFPLENFKAFLGSEREEERVRHRKKFVSDVKKHIDAISTKYIKPDEGTFDFALMYIPAENIYYETIIRDESFTEEKSISHYALNKKVIPVSPNTLYAYLQSILLGLKGLQIEKSAREIYDNIHRLQGEFTTFLEDFELVGKHLNNVRTKYDDSAKKAERFNERLSTVSTPKV